MLRKRARERGEGGGGRDSEASFKKPGHDSLCVGISTVFLSSSFDSSLKLGVLFFLTGACVNLPSPRGPCFKVFLPSGFPTKKESLHNSLCT